MAGNLVSLIACASSTSKNFRNPETNRPIKYWDVNWVNKDHHCDKCGLHFHSREPKKNLSCPWCGSSIKRAPYGSLSNTTLNSIEVSEHVFENIDNNIIDNIIKKLPNRICKHCGHNFYREPGGRKTCPSCKRYLNIKRGRPKSLIPKLPNRICKHCGHNFYREPGGRKTCPSCKRYLNIKRGRPKK